MTPDAPPARARRVATRLLLLGFALPAVPRSAAAAPSAAAPAAEPPRSRGGRVDANPRSDKLQRIARLKRAGTLRDVDELLPLLHDAEPIVRSQAELAIWAIWGRTGSPRLDALYQSGMGQLEQKKLDRAHATFSRLIDEVPQFAEAWNKRATVRFLMGDLQGALRDCREALRRVPDHFGTLAGFGHIYYRLEEPARALAYWRRALAINPNLDSLQKSIDAVERRRPGYTRVVV